MRMKLGWVKSEYEQLTVMAESMMLLNMVAGVMELLVTNFWVPACNMPMVMASEMMKNERPVSSWMT